MANYWFDHVHLISPDPIKTAEFYERCLGATRGPVNKTPDGVMTLDLNLKGTIIKARQPRPKTLLPDSPLTGLEHFAVQTDDIEGAVAELKAKGVKFLKEITQSFPGVRATFFVGPEGVLIELIERRNP
jgi:catechol 2,3-dioxygenase-like lactoylglutathione lyase family enzyme